MRSRRPECPFEPRNRSRREMLGALLGVGSVALGGLESPSARAQASGGALPHLSPAEPLAKALGYTENAANVDRAKFPTYKAGQDCTKCRFYKGTAGAAWGECQIFAGKDVNSKGWCASFSVKT